jgi:hypothetical protein
VKFNQLVQLLSHVGGKMVEHWDLLETLVPREQWKNQNGKF